MAHLDSECELATVRTSIGFTESTSASNPKAMKDGTNASAVSLGALRFGFGFTISLLFSARFRRKPPQIGETAGDGNHEESSQRVLVLAHQHQSEERQSAKNQDYDITPFVYRPVAPAHRRSVSST